MATSAYTLDQATTVFNNTVGHRDRVLQDRKNDPQAYKEWLEAEIAALGKTENPSEGIVQTVERYIRYWMACDTLCKEKERLQRERQSRLNNLINDFNAIKDAK
jgi:hypothetical protein